MTAPPPTRWIATGGYPRVVFFRHAGLALAVTDYAFRDQIDRIKVALSRKHCTLHLFCKCEKGQCNFKRGQIWPTSCTLGTTGILHHSFEKMVNGDNCQTKVSDR